MASLFQSESVTPEGLKPGFNGTLNNWCSPKFKTSQTVLNDLTGKLKDKPFSANLGIKDLRVTYLSST